MLERILPGEEATSALSESLLSAKIITFPYFIGHQKKKKKKQFTATMKMHPPAFCNCFFSWMFLISSVISNPYF